MACFRYSCNALRLIVVRQGESVEVRFVTGIMNRIRSYFIAHLPAPSALPAQLSCGASLFLNLHNLASRDPADHDGGADHAWQLLRGARAKIASADQVTLRNSIRSTERSSKTSASKVVWPEPEVLKVRLVTQTEVFFAKDRPLFSILKRR